MVQIKIISHVSEELSAVLFYLVAQKKTDVDLHQFFAKNRLGYYFYFLASKGRYFS